MESKKTNLAILFSLIALFAAITLWYARDDLPFGALRQGGAIEQGTFQSANLLSASTTAGHVATSSPILLEGAKKVSWLFARSTSSKNNAHSGTTTFEVWASLASEAGGLHSQKFSGLIEASTTFGGADAYYTRLDHITLTSAANATTTAFMDLNYGSFRTAFCVARPPTGAANNEKLTCDVYIER